MYLNDLFYLYEYSPAYMYLYYRHIVPVDVRKAYQTPWNLGYRCPYATTWVLETESKSSVRVTTTIDFRKQ